VFGLSFGEIVLLAIVAIVVVGPRQLPSMMRTAGQWVSRIRRMSSDLRAQSGIDQLMREEGIDRSIQEIRSLQNINVLDGLERMAQAPAIPPSNPGTPVITAAKTAAIIPPIAPASRPSRPGVTSSIKLPIESRPGLGTGSSPGMPAPVDKPAGSNPGLAQPTLKIEEQVGKVAREREYPMLGCDAYGATADEATPYGAVATSDPMNFGATNSSSGGATST